MRTSRVDELRESDRPASRRSELNSIYGRGAVDQAIRSGRLVTVFPGVYSHADRAAQHHTRCFAALRWSAQLCSIGGTSVLALLGWVTAPPTVTVVAPPGSGLRPPAGMRILQPHRTPHTVAVAGLPCVDPPDAILQSWCGSQRRLVTEFLRRRLLAPRDLTQAAARYPRIRHRRQLERLLAEFAGGAESHLEAMAHRSVLSKLSGFRAQAPVCVGGRRYRVDAFHDNARLAVEFDGAEFHADDGQRRRDLERDALLASVGIQTILFTYEDVADRATWCIATLRSAIAARTRRR